MHSFSNIEVIKVLLYVCHETLIAVKNYSLHLYITNCVTNLIVQLDADSDSTQIEQLITSSD